MTQRRITPIFMTAGLALMTAGSARAQAVKADVGAETREKVNARYEAQRVALERSHLADLAALAARQKGPDADETYHELFNLAIANNLYREAEAAAEAAMKSEHISPQTEAMATYVNIIAEADKGMYDESIAHLKEFMEARNKAPDGDKKRLDTNTSLAIGEAYFQRLARGGRFDVARKLAQLVLENSKNPVVKAHFATRLARLNMIGKPAPALSGTDVDGKPIKLSDFKGKVVLVDFWATWCPPCSAEMHRFNLVADRYASKGLVVLGLNEDAQGEGAAAKLDQIRSLVSRYLIDHRVSWPNLIDVPGDKAVAAAYGVTDIPANFLVGTDGTIIGFELSGTDLDRAITNALGAKPK
jgi:thiol-disulfide isomerase/thioredoxin